MPRLEPDLETLILDPGPRPTSYGTIREGIPIPGELYCEVSESPIKY